MKRGKKLLLLLIVLAVLIAATCAVLKLVPDEAEPEDTDFSVFAVDAEAVTELTWTYEGEAITFVRADGVWSYAGDSAFPLDESYLNAMLAALSDVTASKTIEAPEDLAQYGLEEPACTVTVTADAATELRFGDETGIGGERYLSLGDGNVYLVDASLIDSFSYGLLDLAAKETIPSMADVTSVEVSSDVQSYTLNYADSGETGSDEDAEASDEEAESYVWFWNGDSALPLDTDLAETLIEAVTGMTWERCVDYSAADTLADYGLDAPTLTVTVYYTETAQVETNETDEDGNAVYETRESDAAFVLEVGDYADGYCYARIAGSDMVYLIDASISDSLLSARYEDLSPEV